MPPFPILFDIARYHTSHRSPFRASSAFRCLAPILASSPLVHALRFLPHRRGGEAARTHCDIATPPSPYSTSNSYVVEPFIIRFSNARIPFSSLHVHSIPTQGVYTKS